LVKWSYKNREGVEMTKQQIAGALKILWDAMTEQEREAALGRMYTTHQPLIREALQIAEG
jgi:hypothetical protein